MAPSTLGNVTVEQAVFASNNNARVRGYQIVARSPGIDELATHELVKWSPSHGGLVSDRTGATGLCYFKIGQSRLAFGHSVFGTPEFSGRGGLQTVTSYIVTDSGHLDGFHHNPWAPTLLARSMGWLRYTPPLPRVLPTLEMPAAWGFGQRLRQDELRRVETRLAEKTLASLTDERRVAITGLRDAVPTLRWILNRLPENKRRDLTFSIGIQPSVQRPFRLQFLEQADVRVRGDLSADQVVIYQKRAIAS